MNTKRIALTVDQLADPHRFHAKYDIDRSLERNTPLEYILDKLSKELSEIIVDKISPAKVTGVYDTTYSVSAVILTPEQLRQLVLSVIASEYAIPTAVRT